MIGEAVRVPPERRIGHLDSVWIIPSRQHADLSLAAYEFYDSIQSARRSMGRQFRPNRQGDNNGTSYEDELNREIA